MRSTFKALIAGVVTVFAVGCSSGPPTGAGAVTITETTTSTTTTTTTTSSIPLPTVAAFTFSPVTPEVNQVVNFNAASSVPGTGRTITNFYQWDFGDGTNDIGRAMMTHHAYSPSGVYLVTLIITDDLGQQFTTSQTITVRPASP